MTTVLKVGGELLEGSAALRSLATAVGQLAARGRLVIVHGGGRAIDAELRARGIEPRFADGLRVTDGATLDAVVSVLAGRTNTSFVAALYASGVPAVGLTGADAGIGLAVPAGRLATSGGTTVDLGLVGQPAGGSVSLLDHLLAVGYVPVIASVGTTRDGTLLNVNADTLAAHLAGALHARRLLIVGATAGVLDHSGRTLETLSLGEIDDLIDSGTAHSGMVAKLVACRAAVRAGVREVAILDAQGLDYPQGAGTRIVPAVATASRQS